MKDPGGSRCCPIFGERTDSKAQIIVNCVLIHIITKRTQEFIIRRKFLPVKDSQLLYDIPPCPHSTERSSSFQYRSMLAQVWLYCRSELALVSPARKVALNSNRLLC